MEKNLLGNVHIIVDGQASTVAKLKNSIPNSSWMAGKRDFQKKSLFFI